MATTARSEAELERELTAAARLVTRREAQKQEAAAKRDELIRAALEIEWPRAKIIALTGLSPARVEQIRRRARL